MGRLVGRYRGRLSVVVPLVILLGLIAGLGVLRRAWKATGIERYQLRWRPTASSFAAGFPARRFQSGAPAVIDLLDGLFFVR